ncbi:MAG: hypothetical protein ACK5LS_10085, partial [Propioniciclava sp.]
PVGFSVPALDVWLVLGLVAALGWLTGRGQLSRDRLTALIVGAGIMACYDVRYLLADPVSTLVGFSAIGTLLVGLVWRALTDGEFTHGGSPALPWTSRILLYLSSLVFATVSLVHGALVRGPTPVSDVDDWENVGDQVFAVPLYFGSVLIAILIAVQRQRTGPKPPASHRPSPGAPTTAPPGTQKGSWDDHPMSPS